MARSDESLDRLGLADYLTALQAELNKARLRYDAEDPGFSVDGFTLELDIMFTLGKTRSPAKGAAQFWVQAVAEQDKAETTRSATPSVQRLIVRMSPGSRDRSSNEPPDEGQATTPLPART